MTDSLNISMPEMERPCTRRLFPFWRGTLPPQEGAAHRPAASLPIQSDRMSHCHGSRIIPPIRRSSAASIPSLSRYCGAILSDGSWLPISLSFREDLADLVATVLRPSDLFNLPYRFPVLFGKRRQCACIITGVDAACQHTRKCFQLLEPVPASGDAFHFHDPNSPFQKSLVCKSALDGAGSPRGRGRGLPPPVRYQFPSLTNSAFFVPVWLISDRFPFIALQQ